MHFYHYPVDSSIHLSYNRSKVETSSASCIVLNGYTEITDIRLFKFIREWKKTIVTQMFKFEIICQ